MTNRLLNSHLKGKASVLEDGLEDAEEDNFSKQVCEYSSKKVRTNMVDTPGKSSMQKWKSYPGDKNL